MDQNIKSESFLIKEYQVKETLDVIREGGYKVIALQFPDDILGDSDTVFDLLSRECDSDFYILGDTTFGGCCVDEVAASHVDAELIVHYGSPCLSGPRRIPCYYVVPERTLDINKCAEMFTLKYSKDDSVFVVSSPLYRNCAMDVARILRYAGYDKITNVPVQAGLILPSRNECSGYFAHNLEPDSKIYYIGPDSDHLFNISITNALSQIDWFDPDTSTSSAVSCISSKALQRRYFQLESAKDAKIFGIVIGTLGNPSDLNVLKYIKDIIKRNNRKSYTIAVGKPNPQKLGNFLEVDCFVLLACPECSFLEPRDYYRPIITVYELVVALESIQLDLRYIVSSQQVVKSLKITEKPHMDADGSPRDSDAISCSDGYSPSNAIICQPKSLDKAANYEVLLSRKVQTAAEFLDLRTYRGLEIGKTSNPAAAIKDGRHGCASGYENELF